MNRHNLSTSAVQAMYVLISILLLSSGTAYSRTLIFQSGSDSVNSADTLNSSGQATTNTDSSIVTHDNSNTKAISSGNGSANLGSGMSANSELFFMIEQLQQEVNSLRGLVEEQGYALRMLKQSAKDRYLDLDTRILDITKRLSASVQANKLPSVQSVSQIDSSEGVLGSKSLDSKQTKPELAEKVPTEVREPTKSENEAYQKAYTLIKEKKFDESIMALFNYTENYPESPLLPNVYYWLGEVYLATAKYDQAKTSFSFVVTAYPNSQKTPDALYKLAVTLDRLGDVIAAKEYIAEVQNKYPNSTASKLAAGYKF